MNDLPVCYRGASLAVLLRVRRTETGAPLSLADYEAEACFYTRLVGEKLGFSTRKTGPLEILRIDDGTLGVNIAPAMTETLPAGECRVQVKPIHRPTGAVRMAVRKILLLEPSVKMKNL